MLVKFESSEVRIQADSPGDEVVLNELSGDLQKERILHFVRETGMRCVVSLPVMSSDFSDMFRENRDQFPEDWDDPRILDFMSNYIISNIDEITELARGD